MAEDRNLLERAQDYLVSGDFDRDARYVLGPHLSKGLSGLAQLIGPGADIKAGMDEVERIVPSLREGNVTGALAATGLAGATPLFMVSPGSAKEVRQVSQEVVSPLRRLFEDLPEETKQSLPKQPNETGLYGYHGSSKGRVEKEGEDYFDIKFGNPNDQFMGEGFYFTINPKVAEEYANLRATKDFQPMTRPDPNRPGKRKDTGEYINPKTKEKATLASLMRGIDIEGNPLLAGQNISRFDLGGLRKPFIVNNNKQRLYAKENIEKLKEEGYDSIMFREFEDRSQQILVFPEHINKVVFKYAGGQIKKGGSVVERNPYNYLPRSI
tara:strand:- start:691 stop:1665 length:975 start_codon:yes stop_codon:yes gene_type:complete